MNIIVRRSGALGDVVLTTPIIRALAQQSPYAAIHVVTGHPWVFEGNPRAAKGAVQHPRDRVIDLDLAYERRPQMHIVDAYAAEAGLELADADKQQELWTGRAVIRRNLVDRLVPAGSVLIHPARSWPNRTLDEFTWGVVAVGVIEAGRVPVVLGTGRDITVPTIALSRPILDLRDQLTPMEIAYAAERAACFIGSDSGLLHVVGATDCPIVGIFTSARAGYRLPYRHGTLGWRCEAVTPALDCYGCLHDEPPPVTACGCRRGDLACVSQITPKAIVDAALRLLDGQEA